MNETAWRQLWTTLDALEQRARDLRRLSQEEPLRKARPDYPSAHVGRPHDDEVRAVFAELAGAFADASRLLPQAVPATGTRDEAPEALATRLAALEKLAASLAREAFEPLPALPPHAPPYLVTLPGHDLPGSKALLLAQGIDDTVASLRNAMLAAANEMPSGPIAGHR
jgi:hypothetical protein